MNVDKEIYKMCKRIAHKAHRGQLRIGGASYIDHPEQLAELFDCSIDKSIAILHDALEDGMCNGVNIKYIEDEFNAFDKAQTHSHISKLKLILDSVVGLTHNPNQRYLEYIENIVALGLTRFKIMDIVINLADSPSEKQKVKYIQAMQLLIY